MNDLGGNGPWGAFWRQAALHDCTAQFPVAARQTIAARWRDWFSRLERATSIVDLGTGRGAVLDHARRALPDADAVSLIGVDLVTRIPPGSDFMQFRGGIGLDDLPFADRSADAVVSQFGVEYAGIVAAMAEAARICADDFLALVHAREGEVCRQASEQVAQLHWLLDELSLRDRLAAALAPHAPEHLAAIEEQISERASGAGNRLVLDGTRAFVGALRGAPDAGSAEADDFAAQLTEHARRMKMMVAAAPTQEALEEAVRLLRDRGFRARIEECNASGHLVGHWIEAQRAPV